MSTTWPLVLASASPVRARILEAAGVPHQVDAPAVDEATSKHALRREVASTEAAAMTLAELKAMQVARRHDGALVIGADQILECGGRWFDKPVDREAAQTTLRTLRGRDHALVSGVCVVRDGEVLWRHAERARLVMRDFTDQFLDAYLDRLGGAVTESVGAYQLEGLGAQLFSRIDGDFFTILGLPLLPLLDFLRGHEVVPR